MERCVTLIYKYIIVVVVGSGLISKRLVYHQYGPWYGYIACTRDDDHSVKWNYVDECKCCCKPLDDDATEI